MSRGYGERLGAWQAWVYFHTIDGRVPVAYAHQCGGLGKLYLSCLGDTVCPSCHFEISHPERECEPLHQLVES